MPVRVFLLIQLLPAQDETNERAREAPKIAQIARAGIANLHHGRSPPQQRLTQTLDAQKIAHTFVRAIF